MPKGVHVHNFKTEAALNLALQPTSRSSHDGMHHSTEFLHNSKCQGKFKQQWECNWSSNQSNLEPHNFGWQCHVKQSTHNSDLKNKSLRKPL
eukprot:2102461-Amphidinium_carterae.1